MKKLFLILFFFLVCFKGAMAQNDFLQFVNGKQQRVAVTGVLKEGVNVIGQRGEEIFISAVEIAFIENEKRGMMLFNYDPKARDVNTPTLKQIAAESPRSLAKRGGKVYVPIASSQQKEVLGRYNMREELLLNHKIWKLVYIENEAEFILEYFYEPDGGYFTLKTREGKVFYRSLKVKSGGEPVPTMESRNLVESLCQKEMPKIMNLIK